MSGAQGRSDCSGIRRPGGRLRVRDRRRGAASAGRAGAAGAQPLAESLLRDVDPAAAVAGRDRPGHGRIRPPGPGPGLRPPDPGRADRGRRPAVCLPLAARWARRAAAPARLGRLPAGRDRSGHLLSTSPPPGEQHTVPASDWILVFLAVGVITAAAIVGSRGGRGGGAGGPAGRRHGRSSSGSPPAVTASFTRSLRHDGVSSALSHWQLWVLILLGIAGLALSTSAYQAAGLSASLPIIDHGRASLGRDHRRGAVQ